MVALVLYFPGTYIMAVIIYISTNNVQGYPLHPLDTLIISCLFNISHPNIKYITSTSNWRWYITVVLVIYVILSFLVWLRSMVILRWALFLLTWFVLLLNKTMVLDSSLCISIMKTVVAIVAINNKEEDQR
jgi:hypothetical protein